MSPRVLLPKTYAERNETNRRPVLNNESFSQRFRGLSRSSNPTNRTPSAVAARGTRNQKASIKPRYPELLKVPRAMLTPRIAPVSALERDNGTSESSPPRKTRSEARRLDNVH